MIVTDIIILAAAAVIVFFLICAWLQLRHQVRKLIRLLREMNDRKDRDD